MKLIERLKSAINNQNFVVALILMVGGFWVGFNEEEATNLVNIIFAAVAGLGALLNYFKDAKLDWKDWVNNSNFWNYLSIIAVVFVPNIPSEAINSIEQIVINILNQNWEALIASVTTFIVFLYKIVTTKPATT